MKKHYDSFPGKKTLAASLITSVLILLIALITSCTKESRPYTVLEYEGDGRLFDYSKTFYPVSSFTTSDSASAIIAEPGDMIGSDNSFFFQLQETGARKFVLKETEGKGYINNRIQSLNINDNNDLLGWFQKMDSTDISGLTYISLNTKISESYLPYLTELSKKRPEVGLNLYGNSITTMQVLEMFKPRFLIWDQVAKQNFEKLGAFPNLEFLSVSLKDSLFTLQLPSMPGLKHLNLMDVSKEGRINNAFLANNPQIERISIESVDTFDFEILKPLTNLKSLMLFEIDTIVNADLLKTLKNIEVLSVGWEGFNYDITKNDLPALRWITMYSPAQTVFTKFINSNPNLEVIEILESDSITDLKPLLSLKKLFGLTILSDTLTDLNTLKSLRSLKFLSLPEAVLGDSIVRADLRTALPDAVLVTNQGICLGAGWLLLLIPFVLIFRFVIFREPGVKTKKV